MQNKEYADARKLNNSGFSLVELLIAITILSIIVAPLLHSFVSSINTNGKARKTMQATAIAEDVMEEFEAHGIADMLTTYQNGGYTVKSFASDGTECVDASGAADVTAQKFEITGSNRSTTGTEYDVKITLDASKAEYSSVNATEIADIRNLSSSTNAVYMDSNTEIDTADKFFINYALGTYDEATIKSKINRNIDINISSVPVTVDTGAGSSTVVSGYLVTASVKYEFQNATAYLQSGASSTYPQNPKEYIIFSNEDDIKEQAEAIKNGTSTDEIVSELANIVICLNPRAAHGDDQINVYNKDNVDTNVYLVMQETDDEIQPTNYTVRYDLYETPKGWLPMSGSSFTAACKLRTNLLSNQKTYYGYHDANNSNKVVGNAYGTGLGNYSNGPAGGQGIEALNIMSADTLTPTHKYNRLYEICVDVYGYGTMNSGASSYVHMTGTVTDSIQAD